jgi:hypothetical protein
MAVVSREQSECTANSPGAVAAVVLELRAPQAAVELELDLDRAFPAIHDINHHIHLTLFGDSTHTTAYERGEEFWAAVCGIQ